MAQAESKKEYPPIKALSKENEELVEKYRAAADVFNSVPSENTLDNYSSERINGGMKKYSDMSTSERRKEKACIVKLMNAALRRLAKYVDAILAIEGYDQDDDLDVVINYAFERRGIEVLLITSCMFYDNERKLWQLDQNDPDKENVLLDNLKGHFGTELDSFAVFFEMPEIPRFTPEQKRRAAAGEEVDPMSQKDFFLVNQHIRSLLCASLFFDIEHSRPTFEGRQQNYAKSFKDLRQRATKLLALFIPLETSSKWHEYMQELSASYAKVLKQCKSNCTSFKSVLASRKS